jgi:hypothetical protein
MGYKWDIYTWDINADVERDANGMLMEQSLTPCIWTDTLRKPMAHGGCRELDNIL